MLISGRTLICIRQKGTGTGGDGGRPGKGGGGVKVFAGTEAAVIDVTLGNVRLERALHASGSAACAGPADSVAITSKTPTTELDTTSSLVEFHDRIACPP